MDMDITDNSSLFNGSDDEEHDDFDEESIIPPTIRFWILLILSIPSIICSLLILWIVFTNKKYRDSLNHRSLIVQLIAGLIYLLVHFPIYLNYLRLGYVWPATPAMCHFWWFVGDGYADTMTIIMAWASFERHMFVFRDQWVSTRKRRILRHYLPITLILIYCPVYYLIVMAFPPCENVYDYTEKLCSSSCLYKNNILAMYDTIFNDIIATSLIAIFCISLIIRVLWHSHIRRRRRIQWHKHRRLIIILLSISFIYVAFNLPMMLLELVQLCGGSEEIAEHLEPYFDFLNYFVFILYPFICFGTMFTKLRSQRLERVAATVEIGMTQRTKSKVPELH